jgi:cytochrome bd-type quinol oxidase subunit 1
VDAAIEIPKLSSLILKHDLNAPMQGPEEHAEIERPPARSSSGRSGSWSASAS